MIFEPVYKLRVIYKNGYTIDFEVTEYSISPTKITWTNASEKFRPLNMNYDEVASVWKVGQRKRLKFFSK